MNRKVLYIAAPLALIGLVTTFALNQPKEEVVSKVQEKQTVAIKTESEPIHETPQETVVSETPTVAPTVQTPAPEPVVTVKSNEQLIDQYNWRGLAAVSQIIASYQSKYPDNFNDSNRERSFAYINNVGRAIAGTEFSEPSVIYIFNKSFDMLVQNQSQNPWVEVGQRYSISY